MKIYILVYSYYIFVCFSLFYIFKTGSSGGRERWFRTSQSQGLTKRNSPSSLLVYNTNVFSSRIGKWIENIPVFRMLSGNKDSFELLVEEKNLKISFHSFLGYKMILALLFAFLGGCISNGFLVSVLLFGIFGVLGYFIPDFLLKRFDNERLKRIDTHLPYAVDLLYVATLAGQNIYNAIRIVVEKYEEDISSELKRFLRDIDLGVGKMEAYHNILKRKNPESFKNLVFLLMQAEKYGSSISEILKQKSEQVRFESFQDSERKARKIGLTMLIPLAFLILPSFVLLIGGPLVYSIGGNFLSF